MGAITSTERLLIGLAPALFVLLYVLGFRKKSRESFGCLGILAMVLSIACLMYAFTPAIQ